MTIFVVTLHPTAFPKLFGTVASAPFATVPTSAPSCRRSAQGRRPSRRRGHSRTLWFALKNSWIPCVAGIPIGFEVLENAGNHLRSRRNAVAGKDLSDSHSREPTLLLRISPRRMLYKPKEQLARASTLPEPPLSGIATSRMLSDDDYRSRSAL